MRRQAVPFPVQLAYWTEAWLERIRDLYAAHDELMAAWLDAAAPAPRDKTAAGTRLDEACAAWDTAITVIDEARKKQMAAPGGQRRTRRPPRCSARTAARPGL